MNNDVNFIRRWLSFETQNVVDVAITEYEYVHRIIFMCLLDDMYEKE